MNEEQKKNMALLTANKFSQPEAVALLPKMDLGFDIDAILLAEEVARTGYGSRNIRVMGYLLNKWDEKGWHTVEEIKAGSNSEFRIKPLLKIEGRFLTEAERRYAESWVAMGFEDQVISMAYERTCLNTGGLNWAYMNKVLQNWHQNDWHTADAVRAGKKAQEKEENQKIKKLEDEISQLKGKVIELQDSLIKELDRVRQLMEENDELRRTIAQHGTE